MGRFTFWVPSALLVPGENLSCNKWELERGVMVRGYRTFKEFQGAGEGIVTNILSDRLRRPRNAGIVLAELVAENDKSDVRRVNYRLTEKEIDLAPVMLELLIWGARHENTEDAGKVLDFTQPAKLISKTS